MPGAQLRNTTLILPLLCGVEEGAGVRRRVISSSNPLTPSLSPLGRGEGVGSSAELRPYARAAGRAEDPVHRIIYSPIRNSPGHVRLPSQ